MSVLESFKKVIEPHLISNRQRAIRNTNLILNFACCYKKEEEN